MINKFQIENGAIYIIENAGPHKKLSIRLQDGSIKYIKMITSKELTALLVSFELKEINLVRLDKANC